MVPARDLVADVLLALQDDGTRWTPAEVVSYLNDGQRLIVSKSPTATAQEQVLTLVAGARQSVPPEARALLEVLRNVDGRGKAITQVSRRALDASAPGWASARGKAVISHFVADARTARLFDVYPPALPGVRVLALLCMEPADIPAPAGPALSDVTGQVFLADEYREALRHYALFRAWSKDAEYGANAAMVKAHFDLCTQALGINTGHPSTTDDLSN